MRVEPVREAYLRQTSKLSSELSSQSGSPSQCHLLGTHWPFWHTKSDSAQVFCTEKARRVSRVTEKNIHTEETSLGLTAGALVAAVAAVVVAVALPDREDAAAVSALELTGLAFRLRACGRSRAVTGHFNFTTMFTFPPLVTWSNATFYYSPFRSDGPDLSK